MKKPFNPDEEILHYCEHICNAHVQTLRLNKDTGTWYWDILQWQQYVTTVVVP